MLKVKICGTTDIEAALMAAEAKVDYLGVVVEVPFSERSVSVREALDIRRATDIPFVPLTFNREVAWMAELDRRLEPAAIQLLGQESPDVVRSLKRVVNCEVWKSIFLPERNEADRQTESIEIQSIGAMRAHAGAGADKLLLDTADPAEGRFGGTGKTSDWQLAARLIRQAPVPTFLSGGIRPENVQRAVCEVSPYGIDLCSGVESAKAIRDPVLLKRLMEAVTHVQEGSS